MSKDYLQNGVPIELAQQEARENALMQLAPWIGGIFEAGGSMSFSKIESNVKGKTYTYYYPLIRVTDNSQERLLKLKELIGGSTKFSKGKSSEWYIRGEEAAQLGFLLQPYAPSRTETLIAFENWANSTVDERQTLANNYTNFSTQLEIHAETYRELVKDEKFLAGVIDARGSIHMIEQIAESGTHGWVEPRLNVNTTNVGLAQALRNEYGGTLETVIETGSQREAFGHNYVAQKTSVQWHVATELYRDLMSRTQPYLQLRSPIE